MSTQQHPENGRPAGRPALGLCDRHLGTPTCHIGPDVDRSGPMDQHAMTASHIYGTDTRDPGVAGESAVAGYGTRLSNSPSFALRRKAIISSSV